MFGAGAAALLGSAAYEPDYFDLGTFGDFGQVPLRLADDFAIQFDSDASAVNLQMF